MNAGGTDPYTSVPVSDRIGYWVRPEIYRVAGVIEGESLVPNPKPERPFNSQAMFDYGTHIWSGDHQLTYYSNQVGQSISLELPPQQAGSYNLIAHYGKARDYGIIQANFDGKDVGNPMDLYSAPTVASDEVALGVVTLTGEKSIFKMTITGKNGASTGYKLGLDYLKLVPVP